MPRDLKNPKLIVLKAALFVLIGAMASALLLLNAPTLLNVVLLGLVIWAFCRAYYFAFYVITNYVDPDFKYAGIFSAIRHILTIRAKKE